MTLIIDRKKWGFGPEGGWLLNSDNNKLCCLGFFSKECGFTNKELVNQHSPQDLVTIQQTLNTLNSKQKKLLPFLQIEEGDSYFINNKICDKLIDVNDSKEDYKNQKQRESKISQLFKKIGVKVKFVGKY